MERRTTREHEGRIMRTDGVRGGRREAGRLASSYSRGWQEKQDGRVWKVVEEMKGGGWEGLSPSCDRRVRDVVGRWMVGEVGKGSEEVVVMCPSPPRRSW
jgi:hypothetical protein